MPVIASRGRASASGFGSAAPYHQPAIIFSGAGWNFGIKAYMWSDSGGVGEQYAAPPGTYIGTNQRLVNIVGEYGHSSKPIIVSIPSTSAGAYNAYEWNGQRGGFVKKYNEPGVYTNFAHIQAWNNDRTMVVTGSSSSPYWGMYEWSDAGYGAKLAYTASGITSPGTGTELKSHPGGNSWIQLGNSSSFSLSAFPWSTALSGGRLSSNSTGTGAGNGNTLSFTPDGNYVFVPHTQSSTPNSGPFMSIFEYSDSTGWGAKSFPDSTPNGGGQGNFNPSGTHFVIQGGRQVTGRIGYITVYTYNGGASTTRMAEPVTGTTSAGINATGTAPSWNRNETAVIVTIQPAPGYAIYNWSNTTGLGARISVPDIGAAFYVSCKFV